MANWRDIGWSSLDSARLLLDAGLFRSCVSRAYFGLYALLTAGLVERGQGESFLERGNPGHQQVLTMLEHNLLDRASVAHRRQVVRASRTVQRARVVADYGPGQTVDRMLALAVLRDAHMVARALRMEHPG